MLISKISRRGNFFGGDSPSFPPPLYALDFQVWDKKHRPPEETIKGSEVEYLDADSLHAHAQVNLHSTYKLD